nr:hypothetical protein [Tanacetum cinerariifolium]
MNKECDLEDTHVNDRYAEGMHTVPLLITGNCMPSGTDVEIDYSKFTYGPKQTSPDKSDSKLVKYAFSESDCSVETTTSMLVPVDNAPKIVYEPKVWTNASIIEEYESASDDDSVLNDDPHKTLKDKGVVNSGCSRHMIRNKAHFVDYQEFKGDSVAFGGSNGRITGKGKIKAGRLDFEDVYYMEELKHYNLFSVSQMCDKKNKGNLVRGLPSKIFENDHTCVACQKGKQHKAPCKAKTDETTLILKDFIRQAENQFNHKVKTIRSNNGTEFKNHDLIEFYGLQGIKREYSNDRTPQQNRVAERKNMTLIEATRTMLADSFLPTTFWVEAVNIACYVLNRILVTKPQDKTPYELLTGRQPITSYLRHFGCHVTILNTIDQLGKFDGKSNLGFLVGYSLNNKLLRYIT